MPIGAKLLKIIMSSGDEHDELDPSEGTESSTSDGSYTPETTSSSEGPFTDHAEEFDYDEEKPEYSVKDWPEEVWQEHYENKPHVKQDACYVIDGDTSQQWSVLDMIKMLTP